MPNVSSTQDVRAQFAPREFESGGATSALQRKASAFQFVLREPRTRSSRRVNSKAGALPPHSKMDSPARPCLLIIPAGAATA